MQGLWMPSSIQTHNLKNNNNLQSISAFGGKDWGTEVFSLLLPIILVS